MSQYDDYKAGDKIHDGYLFISTFAHGEFELIEENNELVYYVPIIGYTTGHEIGKERRTLKNWIDLQNLSLLEPPKNISPLVVGNTSGLKAGISQYFEENTDENDKSN